jgi:hypothetical protein
MIAPTSKNIILGKYIVSLVLKTLQVCPLTTNVFFLASLVKKINSKFKKEVILRFSIIRTGKKMLKSPYLYI